VLLVGEGSLQMTVQEIGSYIRFGFQPIIFVINNGGYSIERAINGPEQTYNDVSMLWDHQAMLGFFGARKENGVQSRSVACKTVEDLEAVLEDHEFASAKYIQVSFFCLWLRFDEMLINYRSVRYSWISLITLGDCQLRFRSLEEKWREQQLQHRHSKSKLRLELRSYFASRLATGIELTIKILTRAISFA